MNTAWTGSSSSGNRRSTSKDRIWRPNALRRARMSISPRWSRSSMMSPAHVPSTGAPVATRSRSGPARPSRAMPRVIVVDSPPGVTRPAQPARSAGLRVGGLEDPRADEHRLGAELHHQRGIGRRRDAPGAEQRDRQPALLRDAADDVVGRLQLLGGAEQLRLVERAQALDLPADGPQ